MRLLALLSVAVLAAACSSGSVEVDSETTSSTISTGSEQTTAPPVAPATSTTAPMVSTTSTSIPPPEAEVSPAWSAIEAERRMINYLAALAAGAYEQAAWSAENNGIIIEGQRNSETTTEALARLCEGGACAGPYSVVAEGPSVVDEEFGTVSSRLMVTHVATGIQKTMLLATFEGQPVIAELPPTVSSAAGPTLIDSLFGGVAPDRVVVERSTAFEIWEGNTVEWVTNWRTEDIRQIEGDIIAVSNGVSDIRDAGELYRTGWFQLMTRSGEVLLLENVPGAQPTITEVYSGDARPLPIPYDLNPDAASFWFDERGGIVISGESGAEGNVVEMVTSDGTDLLGPDYASLVTISVDGRHVAYVDHSSYGAWWSPEVVVRDTTTGSEVGRWVLDGMVICLELSEQWLLACEGIRNPTDPAIALEQLALTAINIETGETNRVETPVRAYLPS